MSTSNQDLDHSHGDAGHDELNTQEEDQLSSGINIFRNIVVVEVPGELFVSEDLAKLLLRQTMLLKLRKLS